MPVGGRDPLELPLADLVRRLHLEAIRAHLGDDPDRANRATETAAALAALVDLTDDPEGDQP